MKELAKWIRHNQGVVVAFVIACVLMVWTYGCESKVSSLIEDGKMVNAAELNVEIESETVRLQAELELLLKYSQLKVDELARAEAIKNMLMDFVAITADAQTVNPAGVVALLFTILGVGAVVDNRIKDKVIKNRPLKIPPIGEDKPLS